MKASVRWLREICPQLPDDAGALAERFTAAGIEVEATQPFGVAAERCLVAEVISRRPHPSRSGLQIVTVDAGAQAGKLEVVCGAPNVPEAGGLVVLAPVGTHLPAKGVTLEKRPIAGVESAGMLCSEAELGLGDDDAGILVLPSMTAPPGTSLARAVLEARDTILVIGLPPNRADGLGHVGLAREAAALFGSRFEPGPLAADAGRGALGDQVSVTIEDTERCPHYGAVVLGSATVGPSPLGVRWRLGALGVRSISNIVDVTNLVMLEYGHPLHAFDLDKVRGRRIVVRRATEGERLLTLDGIDRALSTDDLVICDAEGPVALAGVMGGGNSEITAATRRVFLECAYFEPRGVRRSARRHGLHTESSHRFERGVDWGDTPAVLQRTEELIVRLAGASPRTERRIVEARRLVRRTVALRAGRIGALLGADVDPGEARDILERLGFVRDARPASGGDGADTWLVPSFRSDVSREVDLIEEVARVRGYDAIPAALPAVHPSRDRAPQDGRARRAREAATSAGLSETVSLSFVAPGDLEAVGAPPAAVTLRNPLREDQSVMRTSLLPGLFTAVARARRHGERDARLFSVGRIFLTAPGGGSEERLMLAAVLAGTRGAWLSKPLALDVWDGKGLVEGLVRRLVRREVTVQPPREEERPKHLSPARRRVDRRRRRARRVVRPAPPGRGRRVRPRGERDRPGHRPRRPGGARAARARVRGAAALSGQPARRRRRGARRGGGGGSRASGARGGRRSGGASDALRPVLGRRHPRGPREPRAARRLPRGRPHPHRRRSGRAARARGRADPQPVRRRAPLLASEMASPPWVPSVGSVLARRWRVVERLGGGALAEVFVAEPVAGGSSVALKVLRSAFVGSKVAERFVEEGRRVMRLVHPNIARTLECEAAAEGQGPFLVMELLEGVPLGAYTRNGGRVPVAQAMSIAQGTLAGLAAAHAQGFVHLDLKPDNVFLVRQPGGTFVVKVLDFAMAGVMDAAGGIGHRTADGALIGSAAYLSPEQIAGEAGIDKRADIFSAGAILYEMLTGRVAFSAPTEYARLAAVRSTNPEPMDRIDPALVALAPIVARALLKSREERFPSALEMARALAAVPLQEPAAPAGEAQAGSLAFGGTQPGSRWTHTPSALAASSTGESVASAFAHTSPSFEAMPPPRQKPGGTLASAADYRAAIEMPMPEVALVAMGGTLPSKDLPVLVPVRTTVTGVPARLVALLVAAAVAVGFALGWAVARLRCAAPREDRVRRACGSRPSARCTRTRSSPRRAPGGGRAPRVCL